MTGFTTPITGYRRDMRSTVVAVTPLRDLGQAQMQRSHAIVAASAAMQYRAAAAVDDAVAAISSIAARHGHRLYSRSSWPVAGSDSTPPTVSQVFTVAGVASMRELVTHVGRGAGLADERLSDFVLAVHELLTNAIRHGGGWGRLRLRQDADQLVGRVTDHGPGFRGDPERFGDFSPAHVEGGRGLSLARLLTDRLEISSGPAGVTVTVAMNLPGPSPR